MSRGCQKRFPRLCFPGNPLRVWMGMSTRMQTEGCQPDTDPSRPFQGDLPALCPPREVPRCSMPHGLTPEPWIRGCSRALPVDIFGDWLLQPSHIYAQTSPLPQAGAGAPQSHGVVSGLTSTIGNEKKENPIPIPTPWSGSSHWEKLLSAKDDD